MNDGNDTRLDGIHVLVVDDAPDNRLLVSRFLKIAGAICESAPDGPQGIEKALSGKCDVVLMDIQMPAMDGYEAVAQLRSMNFRKPVIALTAHAMKSERDRCLRSGFDAYLTKPISRIELFETIRKTFEAYALRENNESNQHADIQPDPDGRPVTQEARQTQDHSRH